MKEPKPIDISRFRHLYPFESHFMDRHGLKYHYLDEGQGEPIIMVHGNPTWSFFYRSLIIRLRQRYRCIAPDHIGCGLSDRPDPASYDFRLQSRIDDFEALCAYLQVTKDLTLILHDWGGVIGMAYAVKYPERIRRLVVMNSAAFLFPPGKRLPMRLRFVRDCGPISTPAVLGLNLFCLGALSMAAETTLSKPVRIGLLAPYNSWRNRLAILRFVQDIPLKPTDPSYSIVEWIDRSLDRLSGVPVLFCWGRRDFVFDISILSEWLRRFPGATVHVVSDAGHYLLEDSPDQVGDFIEEFLKRYSNQPLAAIEGT